jgi:hypothetical protein
MNTKVYPKNKYEVRPSKLHAGGHVIFNLLVQNNASVYPPQVSRADVEAKCEKWNQAYRDAIQRKEEILGGIYKVQETVEFK